MTILFCNQSPSCAAFLQPRINSNLPFRNFSSVKNTLGFINGEWRQANSGKTFEVSNPSTGQVLAAVSDMGASETREAIESANKAFSTWQMTTPKVCIFSITRVSFYLLPHYGTYAACLFPEGKIRFIKTMVGSYNVKT